MMKKAVSDQVEDWIERLANDGSRDTRAAFEAWLEADAEHAYEYEQHRRLAGKIFAAGHRADRPTEAMDVDVAPRRWIPAGVAVGALAAAAAAFFLWPAGGQSFQPRPTVVAQASARLVTPVRLEDGTIVILAAGAQAAPRFGALIREVILTGGAGRFIVAPDPARPFVVKAAGTRIVARATVFDVDLEAEGARVTLIEGMVEVWPNGAAASATVALAPGQASLPGEREPSPAPSGAEARLTLIEADGLPLADVLRIANSSGGEPVLRAGPAVGGRRLTGRFDVSDRRALARKLAAALGLTIEEQAGVLILKAP